MYPWEIFPPPRTRTCVYVYVRTPTRVMPASHPYTHPGTCAGGSLYSYTCNTLYREEKEKIYINISKRKTRVPNYLCEAKLSINILDGGCRPSAPRVCLYVYMRIRMYTRVCMRVRVRVCRYAGRGAVVHIHSPSSGPVFSISGQIGGKGVPSPQRPWRGFPSLRPWATAAQASLILSVTVNLLPCRGGLWLGSKKS